MLNRQALIAYLERKAIVAQDALQAVLDKGIYSGRTRLRSYAAQRWSAWGAVMTNIDTPCPEEYHGKRTSAP